MHYPSTSEPRPAPTLDTEEKCTLHDGTWPLPEVIARLRAKPAATPPSTHPDDSVPALPGEEGAPRLRFGSLQRSASVSIQHDVAPIARAVPARRMQPASAPACGHPVPASARRAAVELDQISEPPGRPSAAPRRKKRKRSADSRQVMSAALADAARASAKGDPRPRVGTLRRKAEDLVRRRRLPDALRVMREALALDRHDGESLAYCAWLLHQSSPDKRQESLKLLARAQRYGGRSARVHYYCGMVLKAEGEQARAAESFERALDLDPDDLESARELRLQSLRESGRRPGQEDGAHGLIGWLKRR